MARVLNVAMDMILENADPDKVPDIVAELTGPYRTIGSKVAKEDIGAPAWWHGDEDAYESIAGLTEHMMR